MAQQQRVAGTHAWDKYAKGLPDDLSEEQSTVRTRSKR
jgi:hypothetical protein